MATPKQRRPSKRPARRATSASESSRPRRCGSTWQAWASAFVRRWRKRPLGVLSTDATLDGGLVESVAERLTWLPRGATAARLLRTVTGAGGGVAADDLLGVAWHELHTGYWARVDGAWRDAYMAAALVAAHARWAEGGDAAACLRVVDARRLDLRLPGPGCACADPKLRDCGDSHAVPRAGLQEYAHMHTRACMRLVVPCTRLIIPCTRYSHSYSQYSRYSTESRSNTVSNTESRSK